MGERATMRAARYYGPGAGLVLETVPVPEPGAGEALVRVLAAGVCHTELQLLDGALNLGVVPLTLGHEIAGKVVRLGDTAGAPGDLGGVRLGERVVVYYDAPCGECGWCVGGEEQVCPNGGAKIGLSGDGGFAEYVRVPVRNLLPMPDALEPSAAAPLGCSAAAALHALRAVAEVQAGERALVYGIGGVGLYLVQLAKLAGATVLAVGRSPDKLRLAHELGADVTLDAREQDVVAGVMATTGNEGVEAVFELVGSDETMANSVAALRRRGRLVFVGYGADRLRINPLHLILKELQVRGAIGNTRAELREVLALAGEGTLRSVITRWVPLEGINGALEALRRGEVIGRVVLDPASTDGAKASAALDGAAGRGLTVVAEPMTTGGTPRPPGGRVGAGQAPPAAKGRSKPCPSADGAAPAVPTSGSLGGGASDPLSSSTAAGVRPLEVELLRFIGRGIDVPRDDRGFNDLALRLFGYQFQSNGPYRAFCERRERTPATVTRWQDVPAVPISAFKAARLTCEPIEGAREFNSSGTTRPDEKSRHFHPSLAVYDLNAALNFEAHVLPEGARLPMLVLFPRPEDLSSSSLAHWLALMATRFSADGGRWFVGQDGLDAPALVRALGDAEQIGQPICILAASFALVHALDHCAANGLRFQLPAGSRLMDTGGYKGKSRELDKAELYRFVGDRLGIPDDHLVNMYGMTEHSTQFLDAVLRDRLRGDGRAGRRYRSVPPWARTLVLQPDTLTPSLPGEPGLLCHWDLANRASVMAVLSEDIGYAVEGGFELIGRARGTEARGCSIAVDELIVAARQEGQAGSGFPEAAPDATGAGAR